MNLETMKLSCANTQSLSVAMLVTYGRAKLKLSYIGVLYSEGQASVSLCLV